MRLQGAIFDMDGTLLDSMPAWRSLGASFLRRMGREPDAELDHQLRTMSLRGGAGRDKSDPAVYEMALRRLHCRKEDAVVFEDALFALRTAKAGGFRTAAVYDESEAEQEAMRAEADYYIRSFEDWTALEQA